MQQLILATGNAHKTREVCEILGSAWVVRDLSSFPGVRVPEETGVTFAENAALKAGSVSRALPGALVLADDSGLELDALGGAPGVHSARYAGPGATDAQNRARLLRELAARRVPPGDRSARFRCALALARDGLVEAQFEGAVEGRIIEAARGRGGFGYDPLFVPAGQDVTFAEMAPEAKHRLSHRGRALAALARHLGGAAVALVALAWAACAPGAAAGALENRYDVFGKALRPFAVAFAQTNSSGCRAIRWRIELAEWMGRPVADPALRASFAMQWPDRVRLELEHARLGIVACRRGQEVWAWAGEGARRALDRLAARLAERRAGVLGPIRLPFTEKELVFLPALFEVADAGYDHVAGAHCRVLRARVMSRLANAVRLPGGLGLEGLRLGVWVEPEGYRLRRIELRHGDWQVAARVLEAELAPSLPDALWAPAPAQEAGAVRLPGAALMDLLGWALDTGGQAR